MPSSVLDCKILFSCLYPNNSVSMTPRVRALFRTYLLGWINSLLDLSSVFLLGILELKRDSGVIILHPGNIVSEMSRSLSLSQRLVTNSNYSSSTVCDIACPVTCIGSG